MNDSCHTTVRILNFVGKVFVVCQKKLICKCIKFRGYKFSWLVLQEIENEILCESIEKL